MAMGGRSVPQRRVQEQRRSRDAGLDAGLDAAAPVEAEATEGKDDGKVGKWERHQLG